MRQLRGFLLLLTLSGLWLAAPPASADGANVDVGGEHLITIRAAVGGKTAQQRADAVTDRLPVILGRPLIKASDVHIVPSGGGQFKILVGNLLLVTATPEDGKANGTTSRRQADIWLKQLRTVLPRINALPNPNVQSGQN
jgi:hypothetical protein